MDTILSPESRVLRLDGRGHYIHVGGSRTSLNPGEAGTDALGLSVPEARVDKLLSHYWRQGLSALGIGSGGAPRYHVVFVRPSGELLKRVRDYCQEGKLRPVVGTLLTDGGLEAVSAAHDLVESGHSSVGKVVVQVRPEEE